MAIKIYALWTFAALSASCSSPEVPCAVNGDTLVVQYIPKDPAADCMKLAGDTLGMQTYHKPTSDMSRIDFSTTTIAIKLGSIASVAPAEAAHAGAVDKDPDTKPYATGLFPDAPDEAHFCRVEGLSVPEARIPKTEYTDMDGSVEVFPETARRYAWSFVDVYVTFVAIGTAVTGEVTITEEVKDPMTSTVSECASTYFVSALSPAVPCGGIDAMGNPTGMPDDSLCCPKADLEDALGGGSGINPEFKVKCDPTLLQCVLDWRPGEAFPPMGTNAACRASG